MSKIPLTRKWFVAMCILAFGSIISFFQINSYWADKNHFNTPWLIIGIVLGLCAVYCLKMVNKYGGSSKD